ncbi:MAG: hypothetical protein K6T91_09980 [Firmicutes bacterium]|nr:hypothetical protein [Bacillota bacterium]
MQVEIKVVTSDYEFGLDLVESHRFPERRPVIVPGEAVISKQEVFAKDDSYWSSDVILLGVDINEDTSIEEFASWFYSKLSTRVPKIETLLIAGENVPIDEAEILSALEVAVRQ